MRSKKLTTVKINGLEDAERYLASLGLRISEVVVRNVIATVRANEPLYRCYAHPENEESCAKGTAYKIKRFYETGLLAPYLKYVGIEEEGDDPGEDDFGNSLAFYAGYGDLDEIMGLIRPTQLLVLAGPTAVGKSTLALNIANNAALKGCGVLYISLETTEKLAALSMLAIEAEVDVERLASGLYTETEEQRIIDAIGTLSDTNLFYQDKLNGDVGEIKDLVRETAQNQQLSLVVVDSLQMVTTTGLEIVGHPTCMSLPGN